MEIKILKAELVQKTSKNGNPYTVLELSITDKVKKQVFLSDAEIELIKITQLSNAKN